jgi:hypothetical protein
MPFYRFRNHKRVFKYLSDGTWLEGVEREINGGKRNWAEDKGPPRKVFPLGIYIDETYLTGSGSKTAKPVYATAGMN